jgi:hypothetical protein
MSTIPLGRVEMKWRKSPSDRSEVFGSNTILAALETLLGSMKPAVARFIFDGNIAKLSKNIYIRVKWWLHYETEFSVLLRHESI